MKKESELILDVEQAGKIKLAAISAGASSADLEKLGKASVFKKILPFLRGEAEVVLKVKDNAVASKHIINCDIKPSTSGNYQVMEHRQNGQWEWNSDNVFLYAIDADIMVEGHDLYDDLINKPCLNACVLDYLLIHPKLIPQDWKGISIDFWGTIYENEQKKFFVRRLFCFLGNWKDKYIYLGDKWDSCKPIALMRVGSNI
jgi:hypothetical protein